MSSRENLRPAGFAPHVCERKDDDGRPMAPDRMTCGSCGQSWCERCDPGRGCHYCAGRGYSSAALPADPAESEREYRVLWDNGNSACGELPGVYGTFQAAEDAGRDWATEMVAADPDPREAREAYTFEVEEILYQCGTCCEGYPEAALLPDGMSGICPDCREAYRAKRAEECAEEWWTFIGKAAGSARERHTWDAAWAAAAPDPWNGE